MGLDRGRVLLNYLGQGVLIAFQVSAGLLLVHVDRGCQSLLSLFCKCFGHERHLFTSSAIAENLRLEGELIGFLAPLDRVELSVELAPPVLVRLLVQLLPRGHVCMRSICSARTRWLPLVDFWLEGELGVFKLLQVFKSRHIVLPLLVGFALLDNLIDAAAALRLRVVFAVDFRCKCGLLSVHLPLLTQRAVKLAFLTHNLVFSVLVKT